MQRKTPYDGITGFTTPQQVQTLLDTRVRNMRIYGVPENAHTMQVPFTERLLMVGVLVSSKTMRGLTNKWPNRYPKIEDVPALFTNHPAAFNLIHFNTKEPEELCTQLETLVQIGGPNLHGFQLNIAWPSPRLLEQFLVRNPSVRIVLQVGSTAFEEVSNSPTVLARKVAQEYVGLVDYILLDPSGGLGKLIDVDTAQAYLEELKNKDLPIGLGIAGGLNEETLQTIAPLTKKFHNLSVDAEGRLRDTNDNLDIEKATRYLKNLRNLFS